jgi:hypothetical protein
MYGWRRVKASKPIQGGIYPLYMQFRARQAKEKKVEDQFALDAKLDLNHDEDKKIAGALFAFKLPSFAITATFQIGEKKLGLRRARFPRAKARCEQ